MPRVRIRGLSLVTLDPVKVRIRGLKLTTTVEDPVHVRIRGLRLTTVPAPRVRIRGLKLTTVTALVSNAGLDQTVDALQWVYLSGLASSGYPTGFHWEQVLGPQVQLEPSADVPTPSYRAPATDEGVVISFELTVSDGTNIDTTPDPVVHTVQPHIDWLDWFGELQPFIDYVLDGEAD